MQSITFSCLPIAPLNSFLGSVNELSIRSGKQNKDQQEHSFLENYFKKMIRKSQRQFNLHKEKIKELRYKLNDTVEPERQRLLNQLILHQKDLSSLKQAAKKYQFKAVELKSLFNKLKSEKEKEQKVLSNLIEKNIEFYALIEQNNFKKFTLKKKIEQLQQQNQQKVNQKASKQKQFQSDLQKFRFLLKNTGFSCEDPKSLTENDLEVQTMKNFAQNASIHSEELRNCLSARFQHLIKLKQKKQESQTIITNLTFQNQILQERISVMQIKLKEVEQKAKEVVDSTADEQFKLNSIQMQNLELKARLQILWHSLNDQIGQSNQNKNMMKNQLKFIDDAKISSVHTSTCLSKLIALRIQSQYLQTRINSTILK